MRSLGVGFGFVLCALAVLACAGAGSTAGDGAAPAPARQGTPIGKPFTIGVGETVTVAGTALRVSYDELVRDSRCPPGASCVWVGDAIVRVSLAGAGQHGRSSVELHTYDGLANHTGYAGYRIDLRRVALDGATATFVVKR